MIKKITLIILFTLLIFFANVDINVNDFKGEKKVMKPEAMVK
jgi:hypothetical protein